MKKILALALLGWLGSAAEARARGGGGCLEAGTGILTPAGEVPIEQLQRGDAVIGQRDGRRMVTTVADVFAVQPVECIEMVSGGRTLRLTPEHPVAVGADEFLAAEKMSGARRIAATQPAYNLLVTDGGVFFANGVLVHNKGCFLPDTAILYADGSQVQISAVRPGDHLMAFDSANHLVTATVEEVITHEAAEFIVLTTERASVRVTAEHPFYVGGGRFKTIASLRVGDEVLLCDGTGLQPQHILRLERVREPVRVYNLRTDAPHTFFANAFAVHNKGGGCLEAGTGVLTPAGEVPVERLHRGDVVIGVRAGRQITTTVADVFAVWPEKFIELTSGGRTLRLTPEHPVAVGVGEFLVAEKMSGARLVSATKPAFNLLVAEGGTYFANGVLVHNKGCFLPDTAILYADGSSVPLGAVRVGEQIRAFDAANRLVSATVAEVIAHEAEEYIILTTDLASVRVTAEHPFYVGGGRFKTVEALRVGDEVYLCDKSGLQAQRITQMERVREPVRVYNLRTDAPHTFFANAFAVHNKGGGGGFRSSSSRSSRSGGGNTTDNPLPGLIAFGIFVVVLVVVIRAGKQKKEEENLDYVYPPKLVAAKSDRTRKLLEFLARQDAAMQPAQLEAVARATFLKLQECWQAREYAPMQPLLMPDLYRSHGRQLEGLKRNHEINMIADLKVERLEVVHLRYTHKPGQREFTALITARAKDFYVDDRTLKFLRGDDAPAEFQEFWTFQRQGEAWLLREIEQSRESDALKASNFVEQFTDAQLQQIYGGKAEALGPAGPWLDKPVETKTTKIERMLNFLVQTDKLWDQRAMEERVRQVFLAIKLAEEGGDDACVRGDLFPDAAAHLAEQLAAQRKQGLTPEYRNLCVRKVELILVRNFADNTRDEFTARISAHAQQFVRRADGGEVARDEYVKPFVEFWTFGRLDKVWKLKEVLPPAQGARELAAENVDEDSSGAQLRWYYTKKRAS